MSEIATWVTKSWVVGLMPSVELTPVFSPTDCATTGVASSRQLRTITVRFMAVILFSLRLCG